jgi:hypothetical protein
MPTNRLRFRDPPTNRLRFRDTKTLSGASISSPDFLCPLPLPNTVNELSSLFQIIAVSLASHLDGLYSLSAGR